MKRIGVLLAVACLGLSACGGPSEIEKDQAEIDALGGASDIASYCQDLLVTGDGSANKLDRAIDKIEKAAKASDRSPAVMKDAREAEASLRDCGDDEDASDAADQLDKLTD